MLSLAEEKKSLALKQEFYRGKIQDDIASLEKDYDKIGLWALLGAAVVLGGYVVVKSLSSQKKEKKNYIYRKQATELVSQRNSSQATSPLVAKIKEYMILFLLSIVKEKLTSLLKDSQLNK